MFIQDHVVRVNFGGTANFVNVLHYLGVLVSPVLVRLVLPKNFGQKDAISIRSNLFSFAKVFLPIISKINVI